MFPGQLQFHANTVFMSPELQLISPSNRLDLQQFTARESSLASPVTSRVISPLSSINLTVDIASINLAPSRLTLADLIQTAVLSLLPTPWALPLRKRKYGGGGGVYAYLEKAFWRRGSKWPQGIQRCQLLVIYTVWAVLFSDSHTNCYGLSSCCHTTNKNNKLPMLLQHWIVNVPDVCLSMLCLTARRLEWRSTTSLM